MKDLWGFNKLNKDDVSGTPHGILKEQADLFEKKTGDTLFIRMQTRKLRFDPDNDDFEFGLATHFEIVAPALDSYSYTLFTLYSKPERNYPVALEKNMNDKDELRDMVWERDEMDYRCTNEDTFVEALKEILGSADTTDIIKNLYSKSYI